MNDINNAGHKIRVPAELTKIMPGLYTTLLQLRDTVEIQKSFILTLNTKIDDLQHALAEHVRRTEFGGKKT